jgi:hypothetical protein
MLNFDKFKFLNDNDFLNEDLGFNQFQFGTPMTTPLGPGYGFAVDPSLSIYGIQNSPYVDYYSRRVGMVNDLLSVIKQAYKTNATDYKHDYFIEDLDDFYDIKILRMNENQQGLLDIFVSFLFKEEEYFGVFKDYNVSFNKPVFKSELYESLEYPYIDYEYKIKLESYLYKILYNWFIPNKSFYVNLKENNIVKDDFGNSIPLKKNAIIEVLGYKKDELNKPYIELSYKNKIYYISENNYFWFNWRFEKK